MTHELIEMRSDTAVIKVIGVGGGGGNAIEHMIENNIHGIQFICANTDTQALSELNVEVKIQLGAELTRGLGAGTKPEIGKQAAEESKEHLKEIMVGTDMVFLTAGMGGGTGTGAITVIAEIAKELDILTVAVVTKPFDFEGQKKKIIAEAGIKELEKHVDSLIVVPNQKLLSVLGKNLTLIDAFSEVNNILLESVQGIAELITNPGFINVDFADVKTIMSNMSTAIMGSGVASGENRAREAAEKAITCPLLEDIKLQGARGVMVNISAANVELSEFNEIGSIMHSFAVEDADIKIGTTINLDMEDKIKVVVVATGISKTSNKNDVRTNTSTNTTKTSTGGVDYDTPTVTRIGKTNLKNIAIKTEEKIDDNLNYLDIPAFLRRQAD